MATESKTTPATPEGSLTPVKVFEGQLSGYRGHMKALLSAHGISEDEFMITALNAIKKVPKLLNADRASLFGAILTSAELGLPPNTPMQLSYIIPYSRKVKGQGGWENVLEAQFQIGYMGWLEIMQRNPKVKSINSGVVYDKEEWHYNPGLREPFSHKPLSPSNRGVAIGAYAIAWITGSDVPKVTFLYKEEIEMFKKISQGAASDYSPWNDVDKDPMKWMWRKTAIKQLAKELPKTRELAKAYVQDTAVELGGSQRVLDDGKTVEVVEDEFHKEEERKNTAKGKNEAITKDLGDQVVGDKK